MFNIERMTPKVIKEVEGNVEKLSMRAKETADLSRLLTAKQTDEALRKIGKSAKAEFLAQKAKELKRLR